MTSSPNANSISQRRRPLSSVSSMMTAVYVLSICCCCIADAFEVHPRSTVNPSVLLAAPGATSVASDSTTSAVPCTGFEGLLDKHLTDSLEKQLNITTLNAIQREALQVFQLADNSSQDDTSASKSMMICSQTGSGKTMTFLLPILQTLKLNPKAQALVVAPTRLLLDQHSYLAAQLDPGVVESGRLHFLVSAITAGTPDAFDGATTAILQNDKIRIVALDEVDSVLYGGLLRNNNTSKTNRMDDDTTLSPLGSVLLQSFPRAHFICTAAFLSRAHQKVLLERDFVGATLIREPGVTSFQTQVLVPTLRQRYQYFSGDRLETLRSVFTKIYKDDNTATTSSQDRWLRDGSAMIFCGDISSATAVYDMLREESFEDDTSSIRWQLLHEELEHTVIQQLVSRLRDTVTSETTVIVCTDIAARGLDVPNVRHVILHDVPTTVSSFVHQVGRTARKGQSGVLTSLIHTAAGDAQKYTHLHALKGASTIF